MTLHRLEMAKRVGYARVSTKDQSLNLQNQMLCLNLLTNCIIIWNTDYMTRALEQLKAEGYALP